MQGKYTFTLLQSNYNKLLEICGDVEHILSYLNSTIYANEHHIAKLEIIPDGTPVPGELFQH